MNDRIEEELALLKKSFPRVDYVEDGQWVLIEDYPIPGDLPWNRTETDVCFQIPIEYPGKPPYGFYVPSGILCSGEVPGSYKDVADNRPPFPGQWGFFSWQAEEWCPVANLISGSNLLNYARMFRNRFLEGK